MFILYYTFNFVLSVFSAGVKNFYIQLQWVVVVSTYGNLFYQIALCIIFRIKNRQRHLFQRCNIILGMISFRRLVLLQRAFFLNIYQMVLDKPLPQAAQIST